MPILDKPFVFTEMLRRSIFKSRPSFFNAIDLNKELLIIHSFIEEFNKAFGVQSTVSFNVPNFTDTLNNATNEITRTISLTWGNGEVLYKGVKFNLLGSGITGFTQVYDKPNDLTDPKEVKPATYVVLTADLATTTYADNPSLCGLQSTESPSTQPSVDVEQYTNLQIILSSDPTTVSNAICILATIHPKYNDTGAESGFGFLYNTFNNPNLSITSGQGVEDLILQSNNSLFEYIVERFTTNLDKVYNESQLVRRFNLSDLESPSRARLNIGLSNIVNFRQLVQGENLRDLTDIPLARQNLGLGNAATRNIGYEQTDAAPGNVLPLDLIAMWSGSPSSIPSGWVLCDGENGTQDMSGKFVVGYDAADNDFKPVAKVAGVKNITIGENNLPILDHGVNDGGHNHTVATREGTMVGDFVQQAGGEGNDDTYKIRVTASPNNSTSTSTTGITIDDHGTLNPNSINTVPPYFVVCYIQFKGATINAPTLLANPPALVYPNFSIPDETTTGGYDPSDVSTVGNPRTVDMGSGITLTNPE